MLRVCIAVLLVLQGCYGTRAVRSHRAEQFTHGLRYHTSSTGQQVAALDSTGVGSSNFSILTWNLWGMPQKSDKPYVLNKTRVDLAMKQLWIEVERLQPSVIAFQEYNASVFDKPLWKLWQAYSGCGVQKQGVAMAVRNGISCRVGHSYILSRLPHCPKRAARRFLSVHLKADDAWVSVAALHLISGRSTRTVKQCKVSSLKYSFQYLLAKKKPAVVMGDMNWFSKDRVKDLIPKRLFDPEENFFDAGEVDNRVTFPAWEDLANPKSRFAARLDRVYYTEQKIRALGYKLINTHIAPDDELNGLNEKYTYISDHAGTYVSFQVLGQGNNDTSFTSQVNQVCAALGRGACHTFTMASRLLTKRGKYIERVAKKYNLSYSVKKSGSDAKAVICNNAKAVIRSNEANDQSGCGVESGFRDCVKKQMAALTESRMCFSFSSSINQEQRKYIHIAAKHMGLDTNSEGEGSERHAVCCKSDEDEDGYEADNEADTEETGFRADVRASLNTLRRPSACLTFSSSLDDQERNYVHIEASKMDLTSASEGESGKRKVHVCRKEKSSSSRPTPKLPGADSEAFAQEVAEGMDALLVPGSCYTFGRDLETEYRTQIHRQASKRGYSHQSEGKGEYRAVVVCSDGGSDNSDPPAPAPRSPSRSSSSSTGRSSRGSSTASRGDKKSSRKKRTKQKSGSSAEDFDYAEWTQWGQEDGSADSTASTEATESTASTESTRVKGAFGSIYSAAIKAIR